MTQKTLVEGNVLDSKIKALTTILANIDESDQWAEKYAGKRFGELTVKLPHTGVGPFHLTLGIELTDMVLASVKSWAKRQLKETQEKFAKL